MAKKKKDPLAAAARQVVKDTANKAVKQNTKKQTPKQSPKQSPKQNAKVVAGVAKNAVRNAGTSTKKATSGTVKALPKKQAKPFKASDISSNTGRGVTKQARKQTKSTYTGALHRKAQAKQKEKDIKAGKYKVPNRLGQADEMMLSKEGKNQVNYYKDQWEKAKARGDKAGMQKAHEEAEKVRLTNPATVKTTTYEGPTQSQVTMAALQQYAQAMQAGDEEGMRQAKNLAAYAMLNVPKDNREQKYMTGAYSGGTWGDRALEASESDILKNQKKNLLKSEGAAFASAVPEAAGGYIETVMNAPDIKGGSSQLVVKDPNVDKTKVNDPLALRGQSRYTEEDARAKADHYQAQAEYLKQIAYATTPLPGVAGRFAVDATAAAGGMGIDLAANTLIPGAGLVSMGARTFGSSVQQAKDYQKVNGTDGDPYADAKAYLYGAAIAGTEIASEKMFGGPWSKIYGKGLLDATVKGAKPTIGKTILKGLLEEGSEEVAADIAQWQAPRIYGGETETLPDMLKGAAYDFTLGAALGGLGGAVTAPRQVRAEKVQNLRKRMEAAGYAKDDIDTAFQRMTVGDMEELTDSPDSALEAWVDTVIGRTNKSSQIENQSLTEASGEQSSEQTFGGRQETPAPKAEISRGKAWDALRSRLRESGVRDAQMLRTIRDRMSAEEMEEAANLRKNDFLEWRDRVTSPDYQPEAREEEPETTEEITAEEELAEGEISEEEEAGTDSDMVKAIAEKLMAAGVTGSEMTKAIAPLLRENNAAEAERVLNMSDDEIKAWARGEEPKPAEEPTPKIKQEDLRQQTEMIAEMAKTEPAPQQQAEDITPVSAISNTLGKAGKATMNGMYNDKQNPVMYSREMIRAYNAGFSGIRLERIGNKTITQIQANAMYRAGATDRQSSLIAQKQNVRNAIIHDKKTAGLLQDEYVEKNVDAKKAKTIDSIAKALGVKVFFADSVGGMDPETKQSIANGSYQGGTVLIAKDSDESINFVYGHEITHRMKEISPDAYEKLKKFVMEQPESAREVEKTMSVYASYNIPITDEAAIEEVVADYVGMVIDNQDLLEDFARRVDRNVLQKFLDALKAMVGKLTGKEKTDLQEAIKTIENALDTSVKASRKLQKRGQSNTSTGERFSIKNPVEVSGNLVALHNLTEDKLLKSIENGGFPMPSIAVTKADVEHSNFGDITLLMGRETVDPEADKRNMVYSADVWSPTFPQYEYEPDEKVEKRLRDKFYELSNKYGRDVAEPLYAYGVTLEDTLNRVGGYDGIISREKDNTNMKRTFLADKGRPVPGDVYKTKTNRIPEERINEANAFVENFGESNIEDAMSTRGSIKDLRKYFDENRDSIEDAFRRTWLQMSPDLSEQDASDAAKEVKMPNFRTMLLIISRIREGNIETQSQEYDPSASRKAVDDAVDQEEYEAWLEDLFKGVEKRRGIYNGKDYYTPSGNRRSFSQTHFEVTLENIVRAMKSQNEKNTAGFHGSKTVRAASAKSFKNVAQMHEDESRLQNRTPEEAARLTAEMDSRLSDIINRIYGLKKRSSSGNPFIEFDSIGEIIQEVAETGRFTPSNVKNIFGNYEYDLPKDIADDIVQLIKDIQEMPVNIFEAKPQRVVGLDEIVTAIIPDNASENVVDALEENNIPIERYSSGDNSSRMSVVNETAEAKNVKFSLKGSREFNGTVVLEESTIDKYLEDYASTSPNYAQAYITYMSPKQFLNLTTSTANRARIDQESTPLDTERLGDVTRHQPFQLRIDHETGEVYGHEGRHRMAALEREGIYRVPVLLFDYSNKYDKERIGVLDLVGQDFGSSRSYALESVVNVIPLSRANRDKIVERFSRRAVGDSGKETVRYSIKRRDSEYLQAVRAGDMEKAQKMVDEAAKENGYTVEAYHGTSNYGFNTFELTSDEAHGRYFGNGFYFTSVKEVAEKRYANKGGYLDPKTWKIVEYTPGVYNVRLNLGNTFEIDYSDIQKKYSKKRELDEYIQNNADGKDSLTIKNIKDGINIQSTVYVVYNPSQIKSADPVVYDDNGEVIPLSERFNPDNPDIRWSLRGGRTSEELAEAYGVIPPGEKRTREVRVPRQTADENRVSKSIRTVMEAQLTPEELLPTLDDMIANGEFSYNPITDKAALSKARATLKEKGFLDAYAEWKNDVDEGKVSKDIVTLGWILYDQSLKDGDVDTTLNILTKMSRTLRIAGQAVQATRILKTLPTEVQMRLIPDPKPKHVQDKIDEYENDDEDWEEEDDVFAPDEYDEETGLPKPKPKKPRKPREKKKPTQEEVDQMEIDTAEEQAKRAKSTFMEKWNAWRYLAMLFNLRTHDRNIVGNLGFAPIVMSKNLTATVAEIALYNTVGKNHGMQRTKSFYGLNLFHYAWNDFLEMRPVIMGESKYEGQDRDDEKVIFRGIFAPIEKARRLNSAALDLEDAWFSRPQYANALAQFMAANGITVEMMETGVGRIEKGPHKGEEFNGGILQEARAYAVKEAQKATYRDLNDVSQFFMRIGKPRSDNNKVERFGHILIEGIIPFRKTPANILCRAMEYSPAGFAKGMYDLIYGVPKGKKTVAEALDMLCSGFSGTGIFVLGMYLAKMGLLVAKTDDGDDEQKYFSQLLGHQQWALEINGYSITIDWLAPEVVPLFMGAQYFTSQTSGNPIRNISNMLDAASMVIDPVLELSCLSGVQETLDNAAKFAEGDLNTMTGLIATMGLSYMSQGIPTLFGQLERVSQEERMRTFTTDDPNELLSADWQYQIGKISAKIPGWDYHQIPYVDSWGNTETETSLFKRIVANMVSPAYVKKIDTRDINKELQRLYDVTGDGRVLPDPGWKTYTYKDENGKSQTYYLSAEEYLAYGRAKGRNNFDLVQKFIKSPAYQKVSDADKAEIIDDLYYYGEYKASSEYIHNYRKEPYSWVDNYNNFSNQVGGYDVADFIIVRNATQDVKGLKDPKHPDKNAISGTSACSKVLAIYNSGASVPTDPAKHEAFMEALDVAKTYRGYNKAMAEEFLNKTKKKYGIPD